MLGLGCACHPLSSATLALPLEVPRQRKDALSPLPQLSLTRLSVEAVSAVRLAV